MNCHLSQLLLTLGRADRSADDQAALDRHVADCPACAALARQLSGFDSAVATAMATVPVPPALHDHLLKSAFARRGAMWRRTVYRYAALAAGVLLAVGLVNAGLWRYRPALDGYSLVSTAEQDWESREEAVKNWLTKQDLPTDLPLGADLNFAFYSFHGKGELAGREVPVMVFQYGLDQARVYVVREGVLNTGDLRADERSVWKVNAVPHPTERGVTYVVLFTNALEPFLRRPHVFGT